MLVQFSFQIMILRFKLPFSFKFVCFSILYRISSIVASGVHCDWFCNSDFFFFFFLQRCYMCHCTETRGNRLGSCSVNNECFPTFQRNFTIFSFLPRKEWQGVLKQVVHILSNSSYTFNLPFTATYLMQCNRHCYKIQELIFFRMHYSYSGGTQWYTVPDFFI
jgi:hypothetical protein